MITTPRRPSRALTLTLLAVLVICWGLMTIGLVTVSRHLSDTSPEASCWKP